MRRHHALGAAMDRSPPTKARAGWWFLALLSDPAPVPALRTKGMLFIFTVAVVASCICLADDQPSAVIAGSYVSAEGEIVSKAVVALAGETIARVGGEVSVAGRAHVYPDAVISPGLVDCLATLGVSGDLCERADAVQPGVRARDVLNRFSRQFRAALEAGVTTFALAPDDQNLVGGRMAVCQTSGPDGRAYVLESDGPLKLSLAPDVLKFDRAPTARSAALGMLREAFDGAQQSSGPALLRELVAGRVTGFFSVPNAADVSSALELAEVFGLRLVLQHTRDAERVAGLMAGRVAGVVVHPLSLSDGPRSLAAAGRFEQRGVPVAIGGGLPREPADSLRIGAAMAARAGLSLPAARRAITAVPAELLGVGDRVGVIRPGARADLVVFSGDPLDLRSRVIAVYVAGYRVYLASPAQMKGVEP